MAATTAQPLPASRTRRDVDISVRLARHPYDDSPIAELRGEQLGRAFGQDQFVPEAHDYACDRAGFVFCAEQAGKLVASIRALPYETGLGSVTTLAPAQCQKARVNGTFLEVSRFVARRTTGGVAAGLPLLREAARWALENTGYRRLYALAPTTVLTYYKRLGMTIGDEDVWRQDCEIPRRFVHADLAVVAYG
ncbi:hypothetical protein [Streptomyces sp. NPDC099088]|uniref:hypothetical protein n=1 Tax=Streptomyces sp. NPDC099088 TaxID=3366101 RepID=UPI00382820C0